MTAGRRDARPLPACRTLTSLRAMLPEGAAHVSRHSSSLSNLRKAEHKQNVKFEGHTAAFDTCLRILTAYWTCKHTTRSTGNLPVVVALAAAPEEEAAVAALGVVVVLGAPGPAAAHVRRQVAS